MWQINKEEIEFGQIARATDRGFLFSSEGLGGALTLLGLFKGRETETKNPKRQKI
jgi:hypothetical protein